MIGEVVGSYRITGQIAVGGMGVVYKAEHQIIGKQAAVKVLRREFSTNHQVVDRFFNEARALTIIRHPGIVDIYDFGWHNDDRAFYVMEYIEGETLKQRIQKRGILPLENAMRIARSVAGAVGAAHAHGIIHRDLKPDNIFLVPDPEMPGGERIKVLDFGLAKLSEDQGASLDTQAGIVLGTPAYMSPEQCDGNGIIDARADQYALGCILYELLCGRPPFASDSPMELFKAHRFQKPAPPRAIVPLIPAEVERVILKLLSKSRDHRFPDMDRVRIALDNSLAPEADMDTLTEGVPDSDHVTPPPAAPPHATGPMSSLSGSSGQVMGASTSRDSARNVPIAMPQSGPMSQLGQSGPTSQLGQSGAMSQLGQSGLMPQLRQSGPMPQLRQSGPMPQQQMDMLQRPRLQTGSLVARPVRLPSIPGAMRRMASLYWALAGLASIFIGFGIVYMVTSMPDEPAVLLPHAGGAIADDPPPPVQPGPGPEATAQPGTTPDAAPAAAPENLAGPTPDAQAAGAATPGPSGDDEVIEMEPEEGTGSGASPAPATGTRPAGTPATGTQPAGNTGQATPGQVKSPPAPALVEIGLTLQPPGATVTVDGQVRTERPLRLAPRARPYQFVITAPGFQRKEMPVRVDRARSVRIELEHERQGIDL